MITKYEQFIDMLRSRLSRPSLPFAEIIQMVANKNLMIGTSWDLTLYYPLFMQHLFRS
jgi:hypothetical protein